MRPDVGTQQDVMIWISTVQGVHDEASPVTKTSHQQMSLQGRPSSTLLTRLARSSFSSSSGSVTELCAADSSLGVPNSGSASSDIPPHLQLLVSAFGEDVLVLLASGFGSHPSGCSFCSSSRSFASSRSETVRGSSLAMSPACGTSPVGGGLSGPQKTKSGSHTYSGSPNGFFEWEFRTRVHTALYKQCVTQWVRCGSNESWVNQEERFPFSTSSTTSVKLAPFVRAN